jgi:hypothetical protein
LCNQGSSINPGIDIVNGASVVSNARFYGARMRIESGKLRKKGGVNVDDAPLKGFDELRLKDQHKSRQSDEMWAGRQGGLKDSRLKIG